MLYIDLDDFGSIDDDFGHTIGDGVLLEFARRLRESCRPDDVPARLAGDGFALLMVEPLTAEQALAVTDRVVRARHPVSHCGQGDHDRRQRGHRHRRHER